MISQIAWDQSRFVGFTTEQLRLVKQGWDAALDRAYEREQAAREILAPLREHDPAIREWLGEPAFTSQL